MRRAFMLIVLCASLAILAWLLPFNASVVHQASAGPSPPISPGPGRAQVSIAARGRAIPIAPAFLGLSTEYWSLRRWQGQIPLLDRVLALLHVPGAGPFSLRIGGDSAEEALWKPRMHDVPDWVIELTPSWLATARALLSVSGVRAILDLNTLTASPADSAEWARAAYAGLPAGSLAGLEIGNEPDLYNRPYWVSLTAGPGPDAAILPRKLSSTDYVRAFRTYARALESAAPGIPLLGPAVAHPRVDRSWITRLLAAVPTSLGTVSAHVYPYSACALPGTAAYPTVARLLSERAIARTLGPVRPAVQAAHRAGLPLRLTEINSVTCGGRPGVSDSFATALWAPDALFELARAGVDAVNVHVRPRTSNAAFALDGTGLDARPLLYGMLTFARALGPDPRLVPLTVAMAGPVDLKAWAVRVRGGALHVLLIDKSRRAVTVDLHVAASGPAHVQRLLAPAASSSTGVTLAGQHLSVGGTWLGHASSQTITPRRGTYQVTVRRVSAALVDFPPRTARAR